jgi:hypothetical protein
LLPPPPPPWDLLPTAVFPDSVLLVTLNEPEPRNIPPPDASPPGKPPPSEEPEWSGMTNAVLFASVLFVTLTLP